MGPRGIGISRAAVVALAACLIAGASPLATSAASHSPRADVAKKCKKRKHRQKKRHCKRPAPSPALISISPASQDFGVPQIGGESRTFTVANIGGSPSGAPIAALTQVGSDFSIAANGCVASLPVGGSCAIDVHVDTNGAGIVSATLTVTSIPGGTASASMTADIEA
ncbi:MAG TPA: choice-of-anchor D domain-containing protein [Solirubrobacterales bacterium]|nr:choice-of-anchor D domain-containing protein [Solirubrobacterales bacterium]